VLYDFSMKVRASVCATDTAYRKIDHTGYITYKAC
jgi:hypothetical protein